MRIFYTFFRYGIKIYEWLFHSDLRKQQKKYWKEVEKNHKNSKWNYK